MPAISLSSTIQLFELQSRSVRYRQAFSYESALVHAPMLVFTSTEPKRALKTRHVAVQTFPYRLNEETGFIDYDMMAKTAQLIRPKVITPRTGVPQEMPADQSLPILRFLQSRRTSVQTHTCCTLVLMPLKLHEVISA